MDGCHPCTTVALPNTNLEVILIVALSGDHRPNPRYWLVPPVEKVFLGADAGNKYQIVIWFQAIPANHTTGVTDDALEHRRRQGKNLDPLREQEKATHGDTIPTSLRRTLGWLTPAMLRGGLTSLTRDAAGVPRTPKDHTSMSGPCASSAMQLYAFPVDRIHARTRSEASRAA
tara:strand:+ start:5786 stop:6304 length:519 start_codon:yes stop_codon:yes gene_type:complete